MRKMLVILQVALSVVLLLGAGLLVRTLSAAKNQKPGFETRNLLLTAVYMSPARSGDPSESKAAYQDLLERIGALSGVESVSLVQFVPLSGMIPAIDVQLAQQTEKHSISSNVIAPAYFETMKIPVLKGRSFDQRDTAERPGVVVINQAAARKLWPDRDPIGQRIHIQADDARMESSEIIGVVADSRFGRIVDPIQPQIYFTFQQRYRPRMTFVIRATVRIDAQVRDVLRQNYPDMAVIDLVPFSEQIRRSTMDQQMNADIAASFGFLGILLAGTGIFSVMSYTVSRRRREFGVRMAVGATRSDISAQILKEAGRLIAIGVLFGLVVALVLGKIITSVLFGVDPHDLLTFSVIPLALTAIALIAAWVPAHRASRVNPLSALREE
jgi:predicted permease